MISTSKDKTLRLWEIEWTSELFFFKGHKENVNAVSISSDDNFLLPASDDQTIKFWGYQNKRKYFHFMIK
ncbi:MAG: hypothetical protein IPH20_18095 [Bacteroidales bacterium]|nr:hypothetical protein [Bacteroidales bacterium]